VSYAECTLGNHIYYSRYLEILETARNELLRELGLPFSVWQERDCIFPVIECRLRYKFPARYDDLLRVETWITLAQGIRLNFAYRIINQNEQLILEGETCHICTSIAEKPRRLPPELVTADVRRK
jgi:acyl-CoA thioester hydrolase